MQKKRADYIAASLCQNPALAAPCRTTRTVCGLHGLGITINSHKNRDENKKAPPQRCLSGARRRNQKPAPLIAFSPLKTALAPSCSSMRSNWLYLQMRSVRDSEPVLICPAPVPTARSAMNESSVSPRTVRGNHAVARLLRHLDGIERFGDGADLVDLDQNGVGRAHLDAFFETIGISDEEINLTDRKSVV